ncbi:MULTISPECIES: glycosyltransferase family 2 protein [Lysinibacillus]|jgi:cellulose synthase/poly-beta-1,6-N-acetylglucosamine synthase-like glycosyltransferase|uniref:Glycosyltransferase n=1 Tax=Lysinibacillus fusiformis TaxID=28031 RepID=A0A2I0V171_9BACI|nr:MULTISPECIES: glycosyltransferase family 2 protein [Lysinibacillus]KUF34176.1 glycosyltransferase [Lysinibacillus sp. F5]MEE3805942.1 glycosyltransferase family 2 protein [Lysinibacillus fusiformis]PKU51972.1 glycosyltransferase [Lysinibacillus fusiformis]WCH46295.1 glycosyltransferase family 2 protein [Lysinibacillus sp. OF-1]SCY76292.1 Glycosyltransferase, catalytic subunit of cellulose synthase and poly-beta-1,6-N-acetylglucosamine synthase [Lysinibacillus sp. SG9]
MANTLFFISLFLIWIMLLYHMFLMEGGYLHFRTFEKPIDEWAKKMDKVPSVSIFIPAHNEALVIDQTLRAMSRLYYPKDQLEVIVINDNSSDETGAIAEQYAKKFPFIRVIETVEPNKGKGKSSALNSALADSTGDIVVVYDADNTPERMAVWYLVMGLINDPKAAATVGKFRVINAAETWLTRFINIETICFQWMAQGGRWKWFKVATIPGTNFAIRRTVLEQLGGWDVKALAEDTELTIRVYNLGYHIRFFPKAITWEQEPETLKVWWKQRTRWARGNQYVVLKFLSQFFTLKRKSIMFDLFYFFFTYFLFFFGVILSNTLFIINLFYDIGLTVGDIALVLWVLAFLLFLGEVMITLSIEKTEMNRKNFFYVILMYFTYSQMWIVLVVWSLLLEIKRMFTGQEVQWYKTERFSKQSDKGAE